MNEEQRSVITGEREQGSSLTLLKSEIHEEPLAEYDIVSSDSVSG